MTRSHVYITTTIPYVNARPHLGHALEFVQADVLARHYRRRGLRRAGRSAVAERRRRDQDQQRPAAPGGRGTPVAGLRRRRRPVPQALRGAVLRRLRAVLQAGRTGRRPLPRAWG